uniref:non-specific serine/threonine protein kinase n=1 Tax=Panagrellus redivivus TaxID=6233 RepID=A0A7E4ZQ17_PANRE
MPKKYKRRIKKAPTDVVGLYMDLQRQQEYPREYGTDLRHFHLSLEIGDEMLNYFVIRKAGYGHSSIVWLCFDKSVRKFRALKVMKHGVAYNRELKMLTTVRQHDDKPGSDKVVMLLNAFPFGSPMHYVMVFEPLGMSLLALMQRSHSGFEIPVVKKLLQHTLEGLHFLHTEIGCIHSDIKPENIMISVSERSFYLETQKVVERKYNGLGMRASNAPKGRPILSKKSKDFFQTILGLCPESSDEPLNQYEMPHDGSPAQFLRYRHLVQRRAVATELLNPSTVFKIGDLGNAMQIVCNLATFEYRPPENIFLMELSGTFDIWGIAATALETVLQDIIFRPIDDEREQNNRKLYQRMLDILGDYDGSAFADTPAYQEMETELRPSEAIHQSSVDNIRQHLLTYGFKYDEIDELSQLLSCLFVFDGKKRFTAAQALSHKFFAD